MEQFFTFICNKCQGNYFIRGVFPEDFVKPHFCVHCGAPQIVDDLENFTDFILVKELLETYKEPHEYLTNLGVAYLERFYRELAELSAKEEKMLFEEFNDGLLKILGPMGKDFLKVLDFLCTTQADFVSMILDRYQPTGRA